MFGLPKKQECPYCHHTVDASESEWEEGLHQVTCNHCKKTYYVSPQYEFKGYLIEKACKDCGEVWDECDCDILEED